MPAKMRTVYRVSADVVNSAFKKAIITVILLAAIVSLIMTTVILGIYQIVH